MTIYDTKQLHRSHYLPRMQHESTTTRSCSRMPYTNLTPDARENKLDNDTHVSFSTPMVSFDELQRILSRLEVSVTQIENRISCIDELFKPDTDGDNLLMTAVINKREDIANAILDRVPNYKYLDCQNKEGQTVLHLAVILNMVQLTRRLIAWGADVVKQDRNGNTALHLACRDGNMPAVQVITTPLCCRDIESRPYYVPYRRIPQDTEIRNYAGHTCLHVAAMNERYHIMEYLIREIYADINALDRTNGETLLHYAVKTENIVLLTFLVRFRSLDVNIKRYDGLQPLDMIIMLNSNDIHGVLIRAGAESSHMVGNQENNMYTEYDDITINGSPLL